MPGHPRLHWLSRKKDVDARHEAGHDEYGRQQRFIRLSLSWEAAAIQGENAAYFG
jgi:hypothetical protein